MKKKSPVGKNVVYMSFDENFNKQPLSIVETLKNKYLAEK